MSGPLLLGDGDRLRAALAGSRLVFDWNGTLMDDAVRNLAGLNAALATVGLAPLTAETFAGRFRLPMADFMRAVEVPESHVGTVVDVWNDEIGQRHADLAPGALDLLADLHRRGRPAGVVSSAHEASVRRDAGRVGVLGLLAFLAGSVEAKSLRLREVVAASSAPVLYVGDTEYDMTEAIAAGALPVGYAGGYRPPERLLAAGAIAVVGHMGQLAER